MFRELGLILCVSLPTVARASVCDDVDLLIAMAPSDFRQIRGQPDPETDGWYKTAKRLSNAECIIIDEGSGADYDCTWTYPDQKSAVAAYEALSPQLAACFLGKKSRKIQARQSTDYTAVLTGVTYEIFNSDEYDIDIGLRITRYESPRRTEYELNLSVKRNAW